MDIKIIKNAVYLLCLLTMVTGVIYPLIITGIAQLFFPWQANGSLIVYNGKNVGSQFIGQSFTRDDFFQGRPSATTPFPYNAKNSGGTNLALTNPMFLTTLNSNIYQLHMKNPDVLGPIPLDIITSSASGLDPDISPSAARYQAARIAKAHQVSIDVINRLIEENTIKPTFGFLGKTRVNVLSLNIALLSLSQNSGQTP